MQVDSLSTANWKRDVRDAYTNTIYKGDILLNTASVPT